MSVVPKIPSGIYIIHPEDTDASFEVSLQPAAAAGLQSDLSNWSNVLRGFL